MFEELRLVKLYQLKVVDATQVSFEKKTNLTFDFVQQNRYQSTLNYYYAMFPIIVRELKIFLRSLIPDFDLFSDHLKVSFFLNGLN